MLDQDLSLVLLVSILQGALNTYVKGLRLGVNYPSNIILGPYIGPPSQAGASAGVTEEQSLVQLQTVNKRTLQCTGEEAAVNRRQTLFTVELAPDARLVT